MVILSNYQIAAKRSYVSEPHQFVITTTYLCGCNRCLLQ